MIHISDKTKASVKSAAPYLLLGIKLLFLIIITLTVHKLSGDISLALTPEEGGTPHAAWNLLLLALLWTAVLFAGKLRRVPYVPTVLSFAFVCAVPLVQLTLVEALMPRTRDIVDKMWLLNLIIFYVTFLFVFFLCRRHSPLAVLITTLIGWLGGTVNCVAWQFRSLPVWPWDLFSAKTALSVAGDYTFEMTQTFLTVQLSFLVLIVMGFALPVRKWAPHAVHWPVTGVCTAAFAGMLLFMQTDAVFTEFGGYRYLFTPTVYYERNGTAASFLSALHYLNVQKPSGYDAEDLQALAAPYTEASQKETQAALAAAEQAEKKTDVLPNVIVIMNEAFSDLSVLCDMETTEPVLPRISALTENTVKGWCHVSVKGGNTPNSEYEFLLSDAMAHLPMGSIPYQQYIKADTPSLATRLSSLGYRTEALHPYYATGWCRDTVYPMLGFDASHFIDEFRPLYASDVLRGYVSDERLFEYMQDLYLTKEEGSPLFLFGVTMQNHGSYDKEYANFTPRIEALGMEGYKRLSSYLSLCNETDRVFGELIDYFAKEEEHTVILMFGDHQPNDNVVSKLMQTYNVPADAEALDASNRYITPFVMWANYDIPEGEDIHLSASFLSTLLCERAGIPLSGYQRFLQDVMEQYPVVTPKTVMDAKGEVYAPDISDTLAKDASLLDEWQAFAYNHTFDKKEKLSGFFD